MYDQKNIEELEEKEFRCGSLVKALFQSYEHCKTICSKKDECKEYLIIKGLINGGKELDCQYKIK